MNLQHNRPTRSGPCLLPCDESARVDLLLVIIPNRSQRHDLEPWRVDLPDGMEAVTLIWQVPAAWEEQRFFRVRVIDGSP